MDEGKEGTMEKQKNVWPVCKRNARNNRWKRNVELAEKSWYEIWNGNLAVCHARTDNSNKICEAKDRQNSPITTLYDVWQENTVSQCKKLAQNE